MTSVKDIFQIRKGKKHKESDVPTKLRYIQIEDLRSNDNLKYCVEDENKVLCVPNDILIAWDGANAGTIGYGLSGAIGSTLAKLSTSRNDIHIPYVGRYLKSKSGFLRSRCTGATIPHISRVELDNIKIPLPPLETQKKIAAILDKADALRQNDQQILQKYDQLTQSIFLDMFGDPVNNPKGWHESTLESICSKIVDCPHETPKYSETTTDYYCIRSSDIQNGAIDLSETRFVSENTFLKRIMRHCPEANEVVYTREGGRLGNAAQLPPKVNICLGQRMMLFIADNAITNNTFIWAFLNSHSIKKMVLNMSGGGAAPRINISQLKSIPVITPSIDSQNQFATFVEQIEKQKQLTQQSLQKSEELFQSLLQSAFRGELV